MENFPEIPGYRMEDRIGEGGMAVVYRAVQEAFDRPVALKILTPQLASDRDFGRRFLREARIVGQLSHAHIVPVYDVGETEGFYYLSMEWLTEGDLGGRLAKGLSTAESLQILLQIARALRYAHARGFIHRDIKPDNILFRDAETAVLTDFGIARNVSDRVAQTEITAVQSVIGSPRYMSPEQTRGEELDPRSDIYSLGIVAFQMLTGQLPFDGRNLTEIAINRHDNPRPMLPAHLAEFQPILDKLLAYDRDGRYASCDELIRAIEALPPNAAGVGHNALEAAPAFAPDNATEVLSETALALHDNPVRDDSSGGQSSQQQKEKVLLPYRQLAISALVLVILAGWWWLPRGEPPPSSLVEEPVQTPAKVPESEVSLATVDEPGPLSQELDSEHPAKKVVPPTVDGYFAFRDAIRENSRAGGEQFIARYPDSPLAEIVRIHLLGETSRVASLKSRSEKGDPQSQLLLSELYETGWGVAGDSGEARRWAAKAVDNSDSPFAQYHLGALQLVDAEAGSPEMATVIGLLQKAADAGFFLAQTLLGTLYFEGRGVPKDVDQSIMLFERAADQGDRNALFNLGQIYDGGLGLDRPDPSKANNYFNRAAALGHREAIDYIR